MTIDTNVASGGLHASQPEKTMPAFYRHLPLAVVVAVGALLPFVVTGGYSLYIATQFGIYLIVVMGLNVLAGYGGQISLGHGALVGLGAYATAIAMVDYGWSFWSAALLGIVITSAVGGLMALPALRVSTWYLALITLAFAQLFEHMVVEMSWLTNSYNGVVGIPRPELFGHRFTNSELYWLVFAVTAAIAWIVYNLAGSRLGRGLLAIRDNPEAAVASGVSLVGLKLFAFVFSAALAGIGGALYAVQKTVVTPDDFAVDFSIFFLLVMVLGGSGRLWGPLIGMVVFFLVPEFLTGLQSWRMIIYGGILLALMTFAPNGLYGAIEAGLSRFVRRRQGDVAAASAGSLSPVEGVPLSVSGVRKAFGGLQALDGVSISILAGASHAIVGPNGSGKTTLLNMVSGLYRADGGEIRSGSDNLLALMPYQIARHGLGRTFQTPKLINSLSVVENVMLGTYGTEQASTPEVLLSLPRSRAEARRVREAAMKALEFAGMTADADQLAGEIPHGKQRLVEIARALVGAPKLLMLDEPAAGLSLSELDGLERLILAIQKLGTTVIIVEHHLDLVTRACQTVTVLNQGKVLAEGTPEQVFSDPAVLAAYMGRQPVLKEQA